LLSYSSLSVRTPSPGSGKIAGKFNNTGGLEVNKGRL
jgi:hypothetical protein